MKKLDVLIKLLEDAQAEAGRLGPTGKAISSRLGEALVEARGLAAKDGGADEGKRPDELSSANDG